MMSGGTAGFDAVGSAPMIGHPMNPLKSLEATLASLVEGAFGRLFRSEVRPMEIARKLAREMDEHRTTSVSRVYAPNEYAVWLSPGGSRSLRRCRGRADRRFCAYLLSTLAARISRWPPTPASPSTPTTPCHSASSASRRGWYAPTAPAMAMATSTTTPAKVGRGNSPLAAIGLSRRRPAPRGRALGRRSTAPPPACASRSNRPAPAAPRALLLVGGRRLVVAPEGAVIGRGRDCDVVLDDAGISRRHAHIRPTAHGWTIEDLRSTNGVLLNGEQLRGSQPLQIGDRIELGSTEVVFEQR